MTYGVCLLALANCGTVSGPTPLTGTLAIAPELSPLKVGEMQLVTAVLRSGAGDRVVSAAWTSSDTAVAVVDDSGLVSARTRGTTTITARYSDQESIQRVAVVPDLSGRWTGQFLLKECSQVSGPPPNPCRFGVGGYYPFLLTITQTHAETAGKLALFDRETVAGLVRGVVGSDATVTMTDQDLIDSDGPAKLTDWRSVVDSASDAMNGTFSVRRGNESIFGSQVLIYRCEFHAVRER